ncbi:hypothetical protein ACOMHN_021364 [Nucella lapillus]
MHSFADVFSTHQPQSVDPRLVRQLADQLQKPVGPFATRCTQTVSGCCTRPASTLTRCMPGLCRHYAASGDLRKGTQLD